MCGYDLYDTNPNTRTIQTSLNACILDCHTALNGSCTGVTWVESGQAQQYCYYKTPTATFLNVNLAAIQSARRICFPTVPTCPGGDQGLFQGKRAHSMYFPKPYNVLTSSR